MGHKHRADSWWRDRGNSLWSSSKSAAGLPDLAAQGHLSMGCFSPRFWGLIRATHLKNHRSQAPGYTGPDRAGSSREGKLMTFKHSGPDGLP